MASVLSPKEERVVEDMVRIAGGEQALEEALADLREALGRSPDGEELLQYLAQQRAQQLRAKARSMVEAATG
jgi:hypothetical protein